MSLILNILWFILGGFVAVLGYFLGGLVLCITIVGIPFGMQSFRLGMATMAPFGKEVVESRSGAGTLKLVFDVLWILLFGWEIAVAHLVLGIVLCITLIGIPFGIQHFKLIPVSLFPFARELRAER
ncbi:MAG: YccF domain-containing protein [Thermoanaerobaculia bacterium]|nr:YccF domain-containing protein [Thermoanaerobaculia bacterium]